MPKKKNEQPKREMTRRQISHWQRESRLQRFTIIGGAVVILAVLILVGTGVFMSRYAPYRATVIKVGNTEYDLNYYIDTLSYYGQANFYIYQQYGMTYQQYLSYTTTSIAQTIEKNQLIKEAAAKLNPPITVTDAEVNQYIQQNKLTSNQAVKDAVYAQLLDTRLKDYFDKQLPASVEQRAVLAMFLESQSQVAQVESELASGKSFHDLAGQLSEEYSSKSNNGDFGWVAQGVLPSTLGNTSDTVLDDAVFSKNTQVNVLTQAVDPNQTKNIGYWLIEITPVPASTPAASATPTPSAAASSTPSATPSSTPAPSGTPETTPTPTPTPTTPTEWNVQAMLLGSQAQAEQIKAQLDNGADFATLAKANSQYTNASTDGGNLGAMSQTTVTTDLGSTVADAIFPSDASKALPVGKVSGPIADTSQTTKGGIWLIDVTGIENKTLDGNNRTTLTNVKQQNWENQIWTENQSKTQNLLTQNQINTAINQAVARGS